MQIKLKKGWAARAYWRDASGKSHNKFKSGFRTKAAAAQWEADFVAEMTEAPEPAPELTLSGIHDEYMKRLENREAAPRTIAFYADSSKAYLPLLGDVPLEDLTPLKVQQAVDAMRTRSDGFTYRSETVRGYYRALRAELNYAVKMGAIASSPCVGIDLPKAQKHESVIYTPEQIGSLLSALSEQYHPLYWPVSLCARYALRRGEAFGVRWCDIDFRTNTLNVRGNLTVSDGKAMYKCAKTKSSETTVALSDEFAAELRELQKSRLSAGMMIIGSPTVEGVTPFADLNPRQFVCLDAEGKLYNPDHVGRRLHSFQKANGLILSGWHDLRHTYGTLMAEAGVDVVTISKAMRHSTVGITSDQYIDGTQQLKKNATAAMDRIVQFPAARLG